MLLNFYLNFLDFGLENMVIIGRTPNLGISLQKQALCSHCGMVFLGHRESIQFPGSPSPP